MLPLFDLFARTLSWVPSSHKTPQFVLLSSVLTGCMFYVHSLPAKFDSILPSDLLLPEILGRVIWFSMDCRTLILDHCMLTSVCGADLIVKWGILPRVYLYGKILHHLHYSDAKWCKHFPWISLHTTEKCFYTLTNFDLMLKPFLIERSIPLPIQQSFTCEL